MVKFLVKSFSIALATAFFLIGEPANANACPAVLNHQAPLLMEDKNQNLCDFKGKTVLIVNTASQCGFTPQYEGLEKLHRQYSARGLVVLGFPANDFGGQEKGSNAQIAKFCQANYGVSFRMFQKLEQPIKTHPLFTQLAKASGQPPEWNFHKYLITSEGQVISFASRVDPLAADLVKSIERSLSRHSKP